MVQGNQGYLPLTLPSINEPSQHVQDNQGNLTLTLPSMPCHAHKICTSYLLFFFFL